MVGDDDAGEEEARELLSPGGPGFNVLIDHGGVAGKVDDGFGFGSSEGLDGDGSDGGVDAVELDGQLGVPVEVADFAGLETDAAGSAVGLGEFRDAEVDVEGFGDGFVGGD